MKYPSSTLCLILVLPVLVACEGRSLREFRQMVECKLPERDPLLDFWDYGCYCGLGGQGTPVDDLDRCCQTHDECYDKAQNLESCGSIFDSPYFNIYEFDCDEDKRITCLSSNNDCDMFICMCDKEAVDCFANAPYDDSKNGLPDDVCSSVSNGLLPSLFVMLVILLCQTLEGILWF